VLSLALGTPAQWCPRRPHAAASWAQSLALRDPPAFALIFRPPPPLLNLGFAFLSFNGYVFWLAPFFVRVTCRRRVGPGGERGAGGWLRHPGRVLGDRHGCGTATAVVGILNALLPIPLALAVLWVKPCAALAR
jgi:hypothetical protein